MVSVVCKMLPTFAMITSVLSIIYTTPHDCTARDYDKTKLTSTNPNFGSNHLKEHQPFVITGQSRFYGHKCLYKY